MLINIKHIYHIRTTLQTIPFLINLLTFKRKLCQLSKQYQSDNLTWILDLVIFHYPEYFAEWFALC